MRHAASHELFHRHFKDEAPDEESVLLGHFEQLERKQTRYKAEPGAASAIVPRPPATARASAPSAARARLGSMTAAMTGGPAALQPINPEKAGHNKWGMVKYTAAAVLESTAKAPAPADGAGGSTRLEGRAIEALMIDWHDLRTEMAKGDHPLLRACRKFGVSTGPRWARRDRDDEAS